MKLYRVSFYDGVEGHQGFGWYGGRLRAERAARQFRKEWKHSDPEAEIEAFELRATKREVLSFLQRRASYKNNTHTLLWLKRRRKIG